MYAIQALIQRTWPDGSVGYRQIPTFFLDETVQGIVSKNHAENIAREIINSCDTVKIISVHAEKV